MNDNASASNQCTSKPSDLFDISCDEPSHSCDKIKPRDINVFDTSFSHLATDTKHKEQFKTKTIKVSDPFDCDKPGEPTIKTVSSRIVEFFDSTSQIPTPPVQQQNTPKLKTVSSRVVDLFESSSEIPTPPQTAATKPTIPKLKSTSRLVDLFSSSSEIPTPPQAASSGTNVSNLLTITDSSSGIPTPPQNAAAKTRGSSRGEFLVHDGHDCLKTLGLNRQSSFRENWKEKKCHDKKKLMYSTSLSIDDSYAQLLISPTKNFQVKTISPTKGSAQVKQSLLRATHFPASDIRNPICRHHSISPIKDFERRKKPALRSEHSLDECQYLQIPLSPTQKRRSTSHSDYLTVDNQNFIAAQKKRSSSHSDYLELKEFSNNPTSLQANVPRQIRSSSYSDDKNSEYLELMPQKKRSSSHSDYLLVGETKDTVAGSPKQIFARKKSISKCTSSHFDCLLTDDGLIPRETQYLQHPLSPTPVLGRKDISSKRFADERNDSSEDFHLTLSPKHAQIQLLSIHPNSINIDISNEPISPKHATIRHLSPDPEYLLPTDAIQKSLNRKNSTDENYYSLPVDSLVTSDVCLKHSDSKTFKKDTLNIDLCPKHLSPQNSLQVPGVPTLKRADSLTSSSLPPERKFDRQLSQEECLQILPPPLEYSPRTCRHKDQIQVDTKIILSPSPKRERKEIIKNLLEIDDIKISPPAQFSPRSSCRKKEHHSSFQVTFTDIETETKALEVPSPTQFSPKSSTRKRLSSSGEKDKKTTKQLSVEDLEVPPPPQFSPRTSGRKIQLPPLPVEFSPRRSRSQFWDSYVTDSVATLSIVRPAKPLETTEVPLKSLGGKGSLSPTRLERFLSQAVSVQSTLVPIKPPKSSMIGLGVHQHLEKKSSLQEPETKREFSPSRPRRYSLHGSCLHDTSTDSEKIVLPSENKINKDHSQFCALHKASFSEKSTETSHDLGNIDKSTVCSCRNYASRIASVHKALDSQTDSQQTTSEESNSTNQESVPDYSLEVKETQYNIAAMVSPRQLENTLKPNIMHSVLKPRRSWQDGVHQPLDCRFSLQEVALSPIWLPKQPLEPPVSVHGKPKKPNRTKPKLSESLSVEIPISPYTIRRANINEPFVQKTKPLLQPVSFHNLEMSPPKTSNKQSIGVNVALSPRSATASPKKSLDISDSDNQTLSWQEMTDASSPQKALDISPSSQCHVHVENTRTKKENDDDRAVNTKSKGTQCP